MVSGQWAVGAGWASDGAGRASEPASQNVANTLEEGLGASWEGLGAIWKGLRVGQVSMPNQVVEPMELLYMRKCCVMYKLHYA